MIIGGLLLILTATCHCTHSAPEAPSRAQPQEGSFFVVPIYKKKLSPYASSVVFIQRNRTVSTLDAIQDPTKKFTTHAIFLQSPQQLENFVRMNGSSEDRTSVNRIKSGELGSHVISKNLQQRTQFFIGKLNRKIVKNYFTQKNHALNNIIMQTLARDAKQKFILCATTDRLYYPGIMDMLENSYVQGHHEKNIIETLHDTRMGRIILYFFNDVVCHFATPIFTLDQAMQHPRIILDHDVHLSEVLESARYAVLQPYHHIINNPKKNLTFDDECAIIKKLEKIDHAKQELNEGRIPIFVSR